METDLIIDQTETEKLEQREQVKQLKEARYATLTSRAITDEAKELVDGLVGWVEAWEDYRRRHNKSGVRKHKRGPKTQAALRRAVEAIVGDLLLAQRNEKSGGWVYRPQKANSFSGEEVSYRNFKLVLRALPGIEKKAGYQAWAPNAFDPTGPKISQRGKASRFRAAPMLLDTAKHGGIDVRDAARHFLQDLPKHPLVKRAGATRDFYGTKLRGRTLKFERTGKALVLEQQVHDLNEYLDQFDLRGGEHRGYVRVFNLGDRSDFDWNKGGRLYSQGDNSYQRLSSDQRRRMTINDQPVCEIDIRASFLTIYHAHHGTPLDTECDPYELPGLPTEARDVIKLWFVATFGSNGQLERWPREIVSKYRAEHGVTLGKRYPVKRIRECALQRYPLLELWGTEDFGWPDLMYLESEAIVGAMLKLKDDSIPALSVHDSLVVPEVYQKFAAKALKEHYTKQTGLVPLLRIKGSRPGEEVDLSGNDETDNFSGLDGDGHYISDEDDQQQSSSWQTEDKDDRNDSEYPSSEYF